MVKTPTIILGTILMLIGLLGFVSNSLIGTNALFATDATHNIGHIFFGAILLIVVFWFGRNVLLWLKIIGVMIFLLGLVGVLTVHSTGGILLGIAYTNGASNWFHIIAGLFIFILGFYFKNTPNIGMSPKRSPIS